MTNVIFETNMGRFKIMLDDDRVEQTCKNFLDYVEEGFYDGTLFHRVIKGFVIQGGGFDEKMQQQSTRDPVANEADEANFNAKGTIAMARTSDPHSATSQFFINLRNNDALDFRRKDNEGWGYCVFGRVTEGMDVVEKIAEVDTGSRNGHADVPLEPVVVHRVFQE